MADYIQRPQGRKEHGKFEEIKGQSLELEAKGRIVWKISRDKQVPYYNSSDWINNVRTYFKSIGKASESCNKKKNKINCAS